MKKATVKIALLHASNTFNNGSFMMLLSFISHMHKNLPVDTSIEIWLELDGEENLIRLYKAFGDDSPFSGNIQIRMLPFTVTAPDRYAIIGKLRNLYRKCFTHIRFFRNTGISAVIILGGDDISEYYKNWMIISDLFRIYRYTAHLKTILAGQTIGPFRGWRKAIASRCLAGAIIYSRDSITTRYVMDTLGHRRELLTDSADLAFADLPCQPGIQFLKGYDLVPDGYITMVPGGFYSLYTPDKQKYLLCWQKLVEVLCKQTGLRDKKFVFLPHVTRPEDDREIISLLKRTLPYSEIPMCFIEEELMPQQLRQILGGGYFTISCRMHAAISTFQMGKPAIGIGYSVKYDGVIGESLGLPELVIQAPATLFDEPDVFAETVVQTVRYLISNYSPISDKLADLIPVLKNKAVEQIKSITESVLV